MEMTEIIKEIENRKKTTNLAHQILIDNNIYVLPDILTNAGGVTVNYFEWLQNKAGEIWESSQVKEKLQKKMVTTYMNIADTAKNYDLDMRKSAFVFAISKAIEVVFARGIFP